MTVHTRIRKFNTKDSYRDQDLDNDMCKVVHGRNMLFLRGQGGTDFDGKLIGPGNPEAQTEQAMKNVKQL